MAMMHELRHEIRRVTIGRAWISDATLEIIAGELDLGERVVAALTTAGGGNALVATNRRVIVATKRKVAYECPYDALTEVEAKTGFLTRGVRLRSAKRTYMYNYKELDKEGPVEMAAAIRRLLDGSAPDDDNDDEDATEIAVVGEGASALAQLASAYIGVATPSRAEIAALPGLLAEGEQVALIANCRREWDYGALVATDARALFVSEGEDGADGAVATTSWPHDLIERVELGAARNSLAYVQLHTADGVVRIDALDIDGARQAAEFLQSKAGASVGAAAQRELADVDVDNGEDAPTAERADQRELADAYNGEGALAGDVTGGGGTATGAGENQGALMAEQVAGAGDVTGDDGGTATGADENQGALMAEQVAVTGDSASDDGGTAAGVGDGVGALTSDGATQLQSIETLRDSGILTAEEFERMRARIYERESERATQLQSIEALRDSGILTAEEYERMRARIYETG